MFRLMWIIAVAILKVLLCKILALGLFLLVFYMKGRRLRFHSEQWEEYFLTVTDQKLDCFVITTYIVSAILSSGVSFLFLRWLEIPHAALIALLLLVAGGIVSGYLYVKKKRAYIRTRYREIPETILQRREEMKQVGRNRDRS